jgi:hypothetical protein
MHLKKALMPRKNPDYLGTANAFCIFSVLPIFKSEMPNGADDTSVQHLQPPESSGDDFASRNRVIQRGGEIRKM